MKVVWDKLRLLLRTFEKKMCGGKNFAVKREKILKQKIEMNKRDKIGLR